MGANNQTVINAFTTVKFYEEMADKEADRSACAWFARLDNSDVMVNGEHMVHIVAQTPRGDYIAQLANIDYIYDYCINVTQELVAEVAPELLQTLKERGYPVLKVLKPKAVYNSGNE